MFATRSIDKINFADKKLDVNAVWDMCGRYIAEVLQEITHDINLLKECYCQHRVREFDRKFLPQIFAPDNDFQDLSGIPTKSFEQIAKLLDSRVILILGDVGTGKSTFIHYFLKIEIENYTKWNIYKPIFVDFKALSDDIEVIQFANSRIDEGLKELFAEKLGNEAKSFRTLQEIFQEDLSWNEGLYQHCKDLGRGDLVDTMEIDDIKRYKDDIRHFNKRRMQYSENRFGRRIIVVLDNVDHIENNQKVQQLFVFAHSLALDNCCSIIITMRTYNVYGNVHHYDPYSAFNPRYLHLSLPDVSKMVDKRVEYALKIINKEVQLPHSGDIKVSISSPLFREEIQGVLKSFATERNVATLKTIAYYDLRELLRMCHRALASGHLYPSARRQNYPEVRTYDLIQALILGNWRYYNPEDETAAIINIFDDECPYEKGKVLIRIRLLQTVLILGARLVPVVRILASMENLGFDKEDVVNSLQKMIYHSLISPVYPTGLDIAKNTIRAVHLTQKGSYYLDTLIKEVRYYENMRFATYVEKDFWEVMSSYSETTDEERYKGTKIFLEFIGYIEEEWRKRARDENLLSRYPSVFEGLKLSFNEHCVRVKKEHLRF